MITRILLGAITTFRERTRRQSFWMMLLFCAAIAWLFAQDKAQVMLGVSRGVFNSAWCGATAAIFGASVLCFLGIFFVRGSVVEDERLHTGPLLAATPISPLEYVFGRWLGNAALLTALSLVFAAAGVAKQYLQHAGYAFEPLQFVLPFVWILLPAVLFATALSLLIELTPGLAGSFGNVVCFGLLITGLSTAVFTNTGWGDVLGLHQFQQACAPAITAAQVTAPHDGISIGQIQSPEYGIFVLSGSALTMALWGSRFVWVVLAMLICAPGALLFHRFNPARMRPLSFLPVRRAHRAPSRATRPLRVRSGFLALVTAEVQLLIQGISRWYLLPFVAGNLIGFFHPQG